MSELLFRKKVDQSVLKTGMAIPKDIQQKFLKAIGVMLLEGERRRIHVIVDGKMYDADVRRYVNEEYADRDITQIRYGALSSICVRLNEIFSHSKNALAHSNDKLDEDNVSINDRSFEYIEIYPAGRETIEFKCTVRKATAEFFRYLGGENDLAGYQKSYKLVFYKCFFELCKSTGVVPTTKLTQMFRNYYLERKQAGLVADTQVDRVIADVDKSSLDSIYSLINKNPFQAISNHGFIRKLAKNGIEYFDLDEHLKNELSKSDLEQILDLVSKKLKYYYSKIDRVLQGDGPMREIINRILNEYIAAKSEKFAGHPLGAFFRRDIPTAIYHTGLVNQNDYLVEASIGNGNWVIIPWICIFDRSITVSAQQGVYIVYLMSSDGNSIYLTFNQGCTDIKIQECFGSVRLCGFHH